MLLYNFRGKIIDLSTFKVITDFNQSEPVINEGNNYHTYNDLKNYLNNDEYYSDIIPLFANIEKFTSNPFFKIYYKVNDLDIFSKLFLDVVPDNEYQLAYRSAQDIKSKCINNPLISFFRSNTRMRNVSDMIHTEKLINTDKHVFNFKQNFATFRVSNSFLNISNAEFLDKYYIHNMSKAVYELDINSSDWLWISYLNYLLHTNKKITSQIIIYGIYKLLGKDDKTTHDEDKTNILASMYSMEYGGGLTMQQRDIIDKLDIDSFIWYIMNNKSVCMPNGICRTNKHNLAYYGQTATSIFVMRYILPSFYSYLKSVGGNILYTKHDSVIFESSDLFSVDDFRIKLHNDYIMHEGKEIQFTDNYEKIINIFFEKNNTLTKLT